MPTLAAVKAANSAAKLNFAPVAVFVGGTSGVGQGALEAFARCTGGNARVIIIGRNESAAEAIIEGLPKDKGAKYDFLRYDVSKLANVKTACMMLKENFGLSKINYLVMSAGFFAPFDGFNDTGEGIDRAFALGFYSRFKFFTELAPLLQSAKGAGEEARVITILRAGYGVKLNSSDLGLTKNYSSLKCGLQTPTYSSLLIEELGKRYTDISFTHIDPGFVKTNISRDSWFVWTFHTLFAPFSTPISDCAEWMIHPLYDPAFASGAHHLDSHADPIPREKVYLNDVDQKIVYEHFMEVASKF